MPTARFLDHKSTFITERYANFVPEHLSKEMNKVGTHATNPVIHVIDGDGQNIRLFCLGRPRQGQQRGK